MWGDDLLRNESFFLEKSDSRGRVGVVKVLANDINKLFLILKNPYVRDIGDFFRVSYKYHRGLVSLLSFSGTNKFAAIKF